MGTLSSVTTSLLEAGTVIGGSATAIDTSLNDEGKFQTGAIPKSILGSTTSTTALYLMQEINYQVYLDSMSDQELSALVQQVEEKQETLEVEDQKIKTLK